MIERMNGTVLRRPEQSEDDGGSPMPDAPMLTRDPLHATPRVWGTPCEIAPDVFMYPAFVNSYALRTPAGLLLVDPGFTHDSEALRAAVRDWSDAPLHTAAY